MNKKVNPAYAGVDIFFYFIFKNYFIKREYIDITSIEDDETVQTTKQWPKHHKIYWEYLENEKININK